MPASTDFLILVCPFLARLVYIVSSDVRGDTDAVQRQQRIAYIGSLQ